MIKNKEVGVIGLGKFGLSLATALTDLGIKVVGVDVNPNTSAGRRTSSPRPSRPTLRTRRPSPR